jgi:hypothetical protein
MEAWIYAHTPHWHPGGHYSNPFGVHYAKTLFVKLEKMSYMISVTVCYGSITFQWTTPSCQLRSQGSQINAGKQHLLYFFRKIHSKNRFISAKPPNKYFQNYRSRNVQLTLSWSDWVVFVQFRDKISIVVCSSTRVTLNV